ncbi:MAG: DNA-3-methyladenine glycosylase [Pirellulales bacterium]
MAIESNGVADQQRRFRRTLSRATRQLAAASPELGAWIAECGACRLEVNWSRDVYESLVRAIAYQQLHGKAAATILGRFIAGFRGDGFPTPQQVKRAPVDKLRRMGFSAAKVTAIQGIAAAAAAGEIPDRDAAHELTNEELIAQLTQLRGVGKWTVEMLLIFTLGRLDVMPVDDFGVQHGYKVLMSLAEMPKKPHLLEQSEPWRPYRSVAAWYLWRRADAAKLSKAARPAVVSRRK